MVEVQYCHKDAASIINAAARRARRASSADGVIAAHRARRVERLPKLSSSAGAAAIATTAAHQVGPTTPPTPPAVGISAAYLVSYAVGHPPKPEASLEQLTTRSVAVELKRHLRSNGTEGALVETLCCEKHYVTGRPVSGKGAIHVAHAWDASFAELVDCIAADAQGSLDTLYAIDVFTSNLHDSPADPVATLRQTVAGARELLIIIDSQAIALQRLWVLFEAMVAIDLGKPVRVRSSSPDGFGTSARSLKIWEAHVDAIDWVLSEASRKSDDKRIRGFVDRTWEQLGHGVERMLTQLKGLLRREIYGEIFIKAVEIGDKKSVKAALELGVSPERQDHMGNTAEELAAFHGHTDIEEMLFEKRMGVLSHMSLSSFFAPVELDKARHEADPEMVLPFLTESADEADDCIEEDSAIETFSAQLAM